MVATIHDTYWTVYAPVSYVLEESPIIDVVQASPVNGVVQEAPLNCVVREVAPMNDEVKECKLSPFVFYSTTQKMLACLVKINFAFRVLLSVVTDQKKKFESTQLQRL
ncbi:hypothetical protein Bpfe_009425 [Biomphalaria pfeifferi]|uniref:Uncharacterized protein n=1 Tax=Biomphalaria pfeifferi TaxID=112525 RepID=A0AAD8FFH0_BIOPF|nr:hypothetical protein Bpfe_009425 [Biomphalaria pfeifferi]